MRILQIANGYPPGDRGGVETYTQALAQALQARGHAVQVFCRESAPGRPEYALRLERVDGIVVQRVVNDLTDATRFEMHYRNPRLEGPFRQQVQDFQPDVIHFQHALGLSATLLAVAQGFGLPVLATLPDYWFICPRATLFTIERTLCAGPHGAVDCVTCLGGVNLGWAGGVLGQPLYKRLLARLPRRFNMALRSRVERLSLAANSGPGPRQRHRQQMQARTEYLLGLLQQVEVCLAISEFTKSVYVAHGLAADHIDVLPWGIAPLGPAPDARAPRTRLVIGYIGSLQYHKGPDVLVGAFRAARLAASELRIYGQGIPQDVYVDQMRAEAGADERIRLMGVFERDALPGILAGLDLLVIPSRWHETYSLAAREALLAGVPVIATNLGALPEAVHDAVNGYLVPPGDVPALAVALEQAASHLDQLRAGARLNRRAPTLDEHVDRLEQLYTSIVTRASARTAGLGAA